jgi:hypothetical protein
MVEGTFGSMEVENKEEKVIIIIENHGLFVISRNGTGSIQICRPLRKLLLSMVWRKMFRILLRVEE